MSKKKVLFIELNEISWPVIDQLIADRGTAFLPHFHKLRQEGVWGAPTALEQPPHLDPWVTWVTVHTGVTQEIHGAKVLEQDASTVLAKRIWEYVAEAGYAVGVFGSIGAYPPRPLDGFVVPGPFAPGDDTFPEDLAPIQSLNRRHTRAHGGSQHQESVLDLVRSGRQLLRLGLRPSTCAAIALQLLRERFNRNLSWRRVILQPLVNYDFFANLYRKQRPAFATWHTNHAAHYMHHYWRAWNPTGFMTPGPADERRRYGEAVPLGYEICDRLLGKFMRLIEADTVLVVCSSMGQQPFVKAAYRDGKVIVRLSNVDRFLALIDAQGVTEVVPTMVPQINLRIPDPSRRGALRQRIANAVRHVNGRTEPALAVDETGEILTVTPLGLAERVAGITYEFPDIAAMFPLEEVFAMDAPTVKQGMHHPDGVFIAYGKDIGGSRQLGPCTNLDIAPTILSLMGIRVPDSMSGRVLIAP
jgi:hypothetical protein